MRRQAPTARARDGQRLVVGPWAHWNPMVPVVGDVDFGPDAVLDVTRLRLEWFGQWLQDGPDPGWAPVRIFVMGPNTWRDEQEWPLGPDPVDAVVPAARTAASAPTIRPMDRPDAFTYDPQDPAPTPRRPAARQRGDRRSVDQGDLAGRSDVLLYTSAALAEPLELTGPVRAELWISTDVPDTDFVAVLVDVHPDGTAWNLCEGAVRARHALGRPLVAGAVYRLEVDLVAVSVVVAAGHRLRLQVTSSSFPAWEPNPNTGHPIGVDGDADLRVAHQLVHHDAEHPSRVVLPVIPLRR